MFLFLWDILRSFLLCLISSSMKSICIHNKKAKTPLCDAVVICLLGPERLHHTTQLQDLNSMADTLVSCGHAMILSSKCQHVNRPTRKQPSPRREQPLIPDILPDSDMLWPMQTLPSRPPLTQRRPQLTGGGSEPWFPTPHATGLNELMCSEC